jgi:hypothetical protein
VEPSTAQRRAPSSSSTSAHITKLLEGEQAISHEALAEAVEAAARAWKAGKKEAAVDGKTLTTAKSKSVSGIERLRHHATKHLQGGDEANATHVRHRPGSELAPEPWRDALQLSV